MVAMNDEDAADIVCSKLFDHKILVGSMRNKNRFQYKYPAIGRSKGKSDTLPTRFWGDLEKVKCFR